MVFTAPEWVPKLFIEADPPDTVTIGEFMANEKYGRTPIAQSRNPYTCGITGKTYSAAEVIVREDHLARALSKELNFHPRERTEWDKIVCLYSVNTIDYIPFTHAVHRLNGIVTPASAAYSAIELEHQLKSSGAKVLFTCAPLLENALKAAEAAGIPHERIFLLPLPGADNKTPFKTVDDLIEQGKSLPELPSLQWVAGQGARQVAYLCYSSGTSGLPKAVMISHYNVIANVIQKMSFDKHARTLKGNPPPGAGIGVLPFSHIYGLVPVTHLCTYRGEEIVVLPRFELATFLSAIERFKIESIALVPPILILFLRHQDVCRKYDLSSLRTVFTGAAPLGRETADELLALFPQWKIGQGYGMTETATVVSSTSDHDIWFGSAGSLLPAMKAKIVDPEGKEITAYDTPGELLVQGPSVVLGYLHNEKANAETFVWHEDGRWIRTGDEVVVKKSPAGNEHIFIVDRIKELIKVKGHQVAPAELEAHLLTHPDVADCAVIQVPDERAGELPKAYITKSDEASAKPEDEVIKSISKHVEEHKARHKWLKGGIEFIPVIPKSPSGKILRRVLRDKEKEARRAKRSKL
ncbi:unnamed protein product [Clonostachys rosea f. rosea IK726]|uniref:Uncharacterized protein n=1 Tax=Clonostachys rosea f. rosea IK726 TaxID=1349383 RepID=A0ACA9TGF1_BIOOC|nr:unnamed protein product [Clonostachys rosea f. rosea IK726]